MAKKGIISAILGDGMATVTPRDGGLVSAALVVPAHLAGLIPVGTEVWYDTGNDNTGIILHRADGRGSGGSGDVTVTIDEDNIAYIRFGGGG